MQLTGLVTNVASPIGRHVDTPAQVCPMLFPRTTANINGADGRPKHCIKNPCQGKSQHDKHHEHIVGRDIRADKISMMITGYKK